MAAERGVGGRAQRVPGTFCGRWRVPGDGVGSGHRWFGAEVHTEHFAIGAGWRQIEGPLHSSNPSRGVRLVGAKVI